MNKILIVCMLIVSVHALKLQVPNQPLQAGKEATAVVTARGSEVVFEDIETIGGYEITSKQRTDNSVFVNNEVIKQQKLIINFYPREDFVIEPISAEVEGRTQRTKALQVRVKDPSKDLKDSYFIKVQADKSRPFVKEAVEVTVTIAESKEQRLLDIAYTPPSKEGFWVKQKGKEQTYSKGQYLVHELTYLYYPQKAGKLRIQGPKARIGIPEVKEDMFGQTIVARHTTIFAKDLSLRVQPLPRPVELVGDMNLRVEISSQNPASDEPVHVDFILQGAGNYDDFSGFGFDIKEATVYEGEEIITPGQYKKSYSVVTDKDFTIQPLKVKYFDVNEETVKTLRSKPVEVIIKGKKEDPPAKKQIQTKQKQGGWLPAFFWGMGSGALLLIIIYRIYKRFNKNQNHQGDPSLQTLFAKCDSAGVYGFCREFYTADKRKKQSGRMKKKLRKILEKYG